MAEDVDDSEVQVTLSPEQEVERRNLQKTISQLTHENKSLMAQIEVTSPEKLEELKARNKELKINLLQVQKDLAVEISSRKIPVDAGGMSDKLIVFKTELLAYCADRKLDPGLWKRLESL